jgi:hypothetical protein
MATVIQIRRGTAAQWTATNPILADGEFALEKDTQKLKIGDGTTAWNSLPYAYTFIFVADGNETTKGMYEEATVAEIAAGTIFGSTGAKLVVTAEKLFVLGLHEQRIAVAISGSTLTLNCNDYRQRNFDLTTTQSANFTISLTNITNLIRARLTLRVTGTITITMPAAVIMDSFEYYNGRWAYTTNILTITGSTASAFMIEFVPDSAGNIWCFATNHAL